MALYGPYKVGTRIPDTALISVDIITNQLFAVVGKFCSDTEFVPAFTDRQNIDGAGTVTSDEYCGPDQQSRVIAWGVIHD